MESKSIRISAIFVLFLSFAFASHVQAQAPAPTAPVKIEFKVLATNKTSTMEKELNEAAALGFRFVAAMGGETSFGGNEAVAVMMREAGAPAGQQYQYKLLATSKTSTMQKELQSVALEGYHYRAQTVFSSTFGGKEVALIVERAKQEAETAQFEYRLLATKKTSTLQKEIAEMGDQGFVLLGLTVAETMMGGNELVAIMRRSVTTK